MDKKNAKTSETVILAMQMTIFSIHCFDIDNIYDTSFTDSGTSKYLN